MQLRYISNSHLIAEAGGDPWAINESLQAGRPAQISDLAQAFHDAGRCTAESGSAFDEARRRFEASWDRVNGEHPINDRAEVQRTIQSLGAQSSQLPKIGVDLEDIAAALAGAQRTGAGLIAILENRLHEFDNQLGQALDLETDAQLTEADRSALDALIRALEQQAIGDTKSALNQLHSVRSGYSDCLQRSLTILRTDGYDPSVVQTVDAEDSPGNPEEPPQIPPPGTSAEEINRWWKTFGPQQQSRLIADHRPELGNLNGIPVVVRSRVNKAVMNDDVRRVEDVANQYGAFPDDVLGDPVKYGLTAGAIARYNNARRTQEGLIAAEDAVDQDILLLKYQPEAFGGQGAAAIAMGNPDTAANTAVLVTGAGSGVPAGTLVETEAVRVYQESAHADWGKQTAVVLWVGYDAPKNWYDPGLRGPDMARIGAHALAADVTARAFTSAADFHLSPGGHLYVGAASGDAVTWSPGRVTAPGLIGVSFGGLGDDPSVDGYGSTRFKAEVPGNSINPVYDHLHYFDDGSESLFSIADVVSGHGDALQPDGMTARHRGEYGLGEWVDPEFARPATTGHRHRAPTD